MSKWIVTLSAALFTFGAGAQNLTLQQLDQTDFENILKDFSAVFNHTSVSGASSLGTIFGFELGLVAGMTRTGRIDALADESGTDQDAGKIPHGALLGIITVPAGITVEAGFIPKVGSEDFKFNTFSAAVKWTPTDVFLDWPLSVAIKAHLTRTKVEFNQVIATVPTKFDYTNTITGFTLLASKNFVLVDPYAGLQILSAKGDMDVTGSPNVFDSSFTVATSASAKAKSTGFLLGCELKLLIVKLGAEYQNLFGTSRYTGKLSFYF